MWPGGLFRALGKEVGRVAWKAPPRLAEDVGRPPPSVGRRAAAPRDAARRRPGGGRCVLKNEPPRPSPGLRAPTTPGEMAFPVGIDYPEAHAKGRY